MRSLQYVIFYDWKQYPTGKWGFDRTIYCDTENDVVYMNVFHGLSVMLDADGFPLK